MQFSAQQLQPLREIRLQCASCLRLGAQLAPVQAAQQQRRNTLPEHRVLYPEALARPAHRLPSGTMAV